MLAGVQYYEGLLELASSHIAAPEGCVHLRMLPHKGLLLTQLLETGNDKLATALLALTHSVEPRHLSEVCSMQLKIE